MAATSIADLADKHNVSQRRLRRITRRLEMGVGRGKRYSLTAAQVTKVEAELTEPASE